MPPPSCQISVVVVKHMPIIGRRRYCHNLGTATEENDNNFLQTKTQRKYVVVCNVMIGEISLANIENDEERIRHGGGGWPLSTVRGAVISCC